MFGLFKTKKKPRKTTIVNKKVDDDLEEARRRAREADKRHDKAVEQTHAAALDLHTATINLSNGPLADKLRTALAHEAARRAAKSKEK